MALLTLAVLFLVFKALREKRPLKLVLSEDEAKAEYGKIAERRLVRLEGQGLPARGDYPAGSLFIRLLPDTGEPESPARAQLKKFAAAWAA